MPRLVLAGTGSSCGKTTLTAALLRAFKLSGHRVQPFKAGPDYIDPMFHLAASGLTSGNLDSWLLDPQTMKRLFSSRMQVSEAELALIEGVMGYYDGLDEQMTGSTAELAGILEAPVILIVNGDGLGYSICAIISGYQQFHAAAGQRIAGIILNQVSPDYYLYQKEMIERHCRVPVLGYMPTITGCHLGSRHLGLIPAGEDPELEKKLGLLGQQAMATIDLAALLDLAAASVPLPPVAASPQTSPAPCRIGVAWDPAFNFYYSDNFDLLRNLGAELVFFSPLAQPELPRDLDGLYLGGGYPEMFAKDLSANRIMRQQIKEKVLAGLPTIAECGGFLYLGEALVDPDGINYPMCGVVPIQSKMSSRLQHFGYQTLTLLKDGLLGQRGLQVRIHEFHYAASSSDGEDCLAERPSGSSRTTVFHSDSAWIGFPHLHFHSQPQLAVNWLRQCRKWRLQP